MKNKFLRWLEWFTACGKLGSKLMCIYFLLIVLPLGMFSVYAYVRVKDLIQEQTFSAAQGAFDDTCISLERLLGRLDGVIDILSTDPLIYMMASNDPRDYTYIHRLEDSAQLATTFEYLCVLADIDLIRLYVNNDYSYSNTMTNIIQISDVKDSGWPSQETATVSGALLPILRHPAAKHCSNAFLPYRLYTIPTMSKTPWQSCARTSTPAAWKKLCAELPSRKTVFCCFCGKTKFFSLPAPNLPCPVRPLW